MLEKPIDDYVKNNLLFMQKKNTQTLSCGCSKRPCFDVVFVSCFGSCT